MVRRLTFRELCERNPAFKKIFTKMDSNWVKEDGPEMATGNVLKTIAHNGAPFGKFADRGDSGVRLKIDKPGVFEGKYGILKLNKNGTYKYKLYTEAQNPAAYAIVQGLSDGETLREVFRYKVTNGYLKKKSLLKITVFGMDDEVLIKGLNVEGAEHCLFEADLPDGSNMMNGDHSYESEIPMLPMVVGSFDVCARDGFKFLKIGGVTIIDANGVVAAALNTPIMTQYGELIITGVTQTAFDSYQIDYKYTLTDNTLDHMIKGPDSVLDSVVIELEDEDGSHATDSLDFEIKDDLPVAKLTLTGAMLLVDETDGVAADMNETDPLGGDLGMSMLTANQAFNEFSMFGADGEAAMGARVFEFVLSGGEGVNSGLDDHEMMQDIFLFTVDSQTIEGRVGNAMGPVSFTLTIATDGKMTLTQERAVYHDDPMDHDEAISPAVLADDLIDVRLTVTDGDGDMDMVDVALNNIVKFEDDGLFAKNDYINDVMECGDVVNGNVTDNDTIGQDTPATVVAISGGTVGVELMGLFGKLTIESDGKYTYTSNDSVPDGSMDSFTYTLQDSDGDQSMATLKFTFSGDKNMPTAGMATATVDDDGLMGGNNLADAATDLDANVGDLETMDESVFKGVLDGSFGKDGAGGFCFSDTLHGTMASVGQETVTYAVSNGGLLLTATGPRGELFTVEITDAMTGAFTLTLKDNVLHIDDMADDENDALLDIPYVVKDSDGSEATGTLKATFDDDVPLAVDDPNIATVAECETKDGTIIGTLANLLANDKFGADGPRAMDPVVIDAMGDMGGTVSVDAMGNITYTNNTAAADLDIGETLVETFTYTIFDADGDSSQATFTVTSEGSDIVITTAPTDVSVDEDDLPNGNGDMANGDLLVPVPTGSVAYTLSAGATTATVVLSVVSTGIIKLDGVTPVNTVWDDMTNTLIGFGGMNQMDVVFRIEVTNITATGFDYELFLVQSVKHLGDNTEDDLTFTVDVTITDDCNEEATTSFTALIDDDLPVVIDPFAVSLENTVDEMIIGFLDADSNIDDNVGADQPGKLTFANIVSGTTPATGVINGMTVNLTSGGNPIILYLTDNDMTLEGWVGDPMMGGTKVFTVELQLDGDIMVADDKYKVTIHQPIDNGAGVEFSDLSGTGAAGNPTFKLIGSDAMLDPATQMAGLELLVTPGDITNNTDLVGQTINSDADDIGVGMGQSISPSDPVLRIDYGSFTIVGNQFVIDDHETVNGARFEVHEVVPGAPGTEVDINVRVYDADDDEDLTEDATDTITVVTVFGSDGTTVLAERTLVEGDGSEGGFDFDFLMDGSVTIDNLIEGQFISVETADGFNRLEIDNVTIQNNTFSVGGLAVETSTTGDPIDLDYDLALMDADGDTVTIVGAIDITVNPDQPMM